MALKDRIARGSAPAEGAALQPFRRPSGRASFPHRVSLDLDDVRYEWIRARAYEERVPIAGLLRAALTLMAADPDVAARVQEIGREEFPPPSY